MGGFAWVTLATNDSYSLGALILAHSLKQVGTSQQLAVLVTPGVTNPMREKLSGVFDLVQEVNILDSKDEANLRLLKRPELGITFTKLHCWRLTQYEKCVFLDADTLVLQNCDELFEREELSAAPDVGWPDCFNSGVFVYRPSNETYEKLVQFALDKGSFDGGDQGLLNLYFSDWAHKDISKHLPFIYNMCSTACYSYLPAFKQFGGNAKIIHFIGPAKPWLQFFDTETRLVHPSGDMQHLQNVLQKWWNLFCEKVHPVLSRDMKSRNTSSSIIPSIPEIPKNPEIHDFSEDYQNVWNPWDEYDSRQTGNVLVDYQNHQLVIEHICNKLTEYDESSHFVDNQQDFSHSHQHSQNLDESSHSLAESHHTNSSNITVSHQTSPNQLTDNSNRTVSHQTSNNQSTDNSNITVSHQTSQNKITENSNLTVSHQTSPNKLTDNSNLTVSHQTSPNKLTDDSVNLKTKVSFHDSHEVFPITPVNILNSPMLNDPYQLTPELTPHVLPPQFETTTTVSNHTVLHTSDNEEDKDAGIAGAFAQLTLGAPRSAEQMALDNHLRRQGWEIGNIDYLGRDSFENIWSKICETIGESKPAETPTAPVSSEESAAKPKAPTTSEAAQPPTAEVVKEQTAPAEEASKEAKQLTEQPANIEPQIPTTQVLPPTPGTPGESPVSPLPSKEPEASLAAPKEPEVCPIAPKEPQVSPIAPEEPQVCPVAPKEPQVAPVAPEEPKVCPIAPKEPQVCPVAPKEPQVGPAAPEEPQVCPIAPKDPQVCPMKSPEAQPTQEPQICPMKEPETPKSKEPAELQTSEAAKPAEESEAAKLTECPLIPKTPEAKVPVETPIVPEPSPVVATPPTPATPPAVDTPPTVATPAAKPDTPTTPPVVATPPAPATPTTPTTPPTPATPPTPTTPPTPATPPAVATPPAPTTPPTKPTEPSTPPKPEETASAPETTATPTPPPRKGSGGPKKSSKPKK